MVSGIFKPFVLMSKNWRIFLPLWAIMVVATVAVMGMPSGFDASVGVLMTIIVMITWLTTIFLVRYLLAKKKVKLRDGLYNAMTPLLSLLLVLAVAAIQCVPVGLLIVAYSAAIETNFLATTGYAVMFLLFAVGMIMLSGYLLSSTVIAMVSVTAPGLYPLEALKTANDLIKGKRLQVIGVMCVGIAVAALMCALILPVSLIPQSQVVSVFTMIIVIFVTMYLAMYFYLFYRRLLDE